MDKILDIKTGSETLYDPNVFTVVLMLTAIMGIAISSLGLNVGIVMLSFPLIAFSLFLIFKNPIIGLIASLIMGFLSAGLARYLSLPFGLSIDILLFLAWLGLFFKNFNKTNWDPLRNDISLIALIWYLYVCLELLNPEMKSVTAWFYAMRGVGFYQLLAFTLTFMLFRNYKLFNQFLHLIFWLSIIGTIWGLRQKYFGTDAAEDYWLYNENHHEEHILFGSLRVFSFYSDAGQFGSSQAMMSLMAGIIAVGSEKWKTKALYAIIAILTFIGFAISGTRGALAVIAGGGLIYLFINKNFKVLGTGIAVAALAFYILKYTFLFHGVAEIRRMRTALNPDNPSLQARLNNQKTFNDYLDTRPFGGGVGTAGYWGGRFSPNSLLANTPTDSWYVKIWAEMGIVGLSLHLLMLGYIMGKGGRIVLHLKNRELKTKMVALYSGVGGVLISSYGNQVFGQMPTGMIMNIAIPLIMLAPLFESQLETKVLTKNKEL